jgi:hypothetical protein
MTQVSFRVALAVLTVLASPALAQAPDVVRVRGAIEGVDGHTLSVKSRDSAVLKVNVPDNAVILTVVKAQLSDVRQGTFIGVTGMPQPDGTQKAVEIHIFPEAMRGTGEGFRPWDLMPNSTMTNANVDSEVVSTDGKTLVLRYKGGDKTITVPSDVIVVTFAPATLADLKPGEKIFIAAANKQPDGMLVAPRMIVSRNGINPPM